MKRTAYLYVFDTMSDWEPGYLTAELNSGRCFMKGLEPMKTVTVSNSRMPVTTMGGLRVLPDRELKECVIGSGDVLILPGGDTWTEAVHDPILAIAGECLEQGAVVAAICGATAGLARTGILDFRRHTSNDPGFLKSVCPAYLGEKHYIAEPAVTDGNLVTASGVAPVEFTILVLRALGVLSAQTADAWYNLFKTYDARYFSDLQNSIE